MVVPDEEPVIDMNGRRGVRLDPVVRSVVRRIVDAMHPQAVILFGSYARSKAGRDSDLDLLVIMETQEPPYRRAARIRMLFERVPCPMDILVFTPAEVKRWRGTVNHIITEAFDTGIVVYDGSKRRGPGTAVA